nr:immunoglobulin heavy chain junction region [Macaca mulatta]MOV38346.1 immunoglobulin heavy chain junction region [Macaca mulatta]MOV38385.1 immunoglobulin heavy chain junction region [Macaca mulatta]MOV39202.1 immunoglobulin heavy chain junction region [Macaca mulatta]MOV39938.1 immunoglobulin heavy chain junction region [Macaca mulatta]
CARLPQVNSMDVW